MKIESFKWFLIGIGLFYLSRGNIATSVALITIAALFYLLEDECL